MTTNPPPTTDVATNDGNAPAEAVAAASAAADKPTPVVGAFVGHDAPQTTGNTVPKTNPKAATNGAATASASAPNKTPYKTLKALRELLAKLSDEELEKEIKKEQKRRTNAKTPSPKKRKAAPNTAATSDNNNATTTTAQDDDSTDQSKKKRAKTSQQDDDSVAPKEETKPAKKKQADINLQQWEEMYAQMVAYKGQHGHVNVPSKEQKLYSWVAKNRLYWKRFLKGESNTMSHYKIQKLVDLGLGTIENGPFTNLAYDARWEEMYQELVRFKNQYGHCNVVKHSDQYPALVGWASQQRGAFFNRQERAATGIKKRGICLTDERMNKLAAIGFRFKVQSDWDERLKQIIEYKALNGNTRVPVAYRGHNNLGRWVTSIKTAYYEGKVPADRIAKLDAIDFDWSLRSDPKNLRK